MSLEVLQLHPAQRDIYMDQLTDTNRSDYNIGCYTVIQGHLDVDKFRQAVRSLPQVFDVYKMRFDLDDPHPQAYYEDQYQALELSFLDLESGSREAVRQWMTTHLQRPFEFKKDKLLFEHYLIRIAADEHWYFCKFHHLITDGQGISANNQYVAKKYQALLTDADLPLHYVSYREEIIKALSIHQSEAYAQEARYWTGKIAERPQQLLRKKRPAGNCQTIIMDLDAPTIQTLENLTQQTNSSLQSLTLAALMVYFGNTTEGKDLVFGTPIHRRKGKSANYIVGMFSGILPFKSSSQPGMTVMELIRDIAASRRQDYRHPHYEIGDLNRSLKIKGTNDPLIEIIVNQATLDFDLHFGAGLQAVTYDIPIEYVRYPLEFFWRDFGKQQPLQLRIDFLTSYFSKEDIDLLTQRILFILRQFLHCLDTRVADVSLIPTTEKALLHHFSGIDQPGTTGTILDKWNQQVSKTPDQLAVEFEDQTISYRELDEQSNQLGHYLQTRGIGEGVFVPICMQRSIEMIIGILGIMKAGGAYVPVDPSYPRERIDFMVKDTAASFILDHLDKATLSSFPISKLPSDPHPDSTAYIIYTSGSTGQPKGVEIMHKGLLASTLSRLSYYGGTGAIFLIPSFSFDSSVAVIFGSLCSGGKLILSKNDAVKDAMNVGRLLQQTDTILCVPSYYRFLLDEGLIQQTPLSRVILAGEALDSSLVRRHFNMTSGISLYNEYGPTEATVWSTVAEIGDETEEVTIGRPIETVRVYILDKDRRLLPIGHTGEIYIGGPQVARGYLHNPGLTMEKFIPDPFASDPDARLYKTGDVGRWLPDGQIEYLGRIDEQLKIRGYRIEPGEIENALLQCAGVGQSVVIARSDEGTPHRLVAYIVPAASGSPLDRSAILSLLRGKLPDYMVPSILIVMDRLPLSLNGKVDKRALPVPVSEDQLTQDYVAPRNEQETTMAAIWQDLLRVARVGIEDNFFELGGDSIISMQVASRCRRAGMILRPGDLFDHPTISGLSHLLSLSASSQHEQATGDHNAQAFGNILSGQTLDKRITLSELDRFLDEPHGSMPRREQVIALYRLSPLQEGMLFHGLYEEEGNAYIEQFGCDLGYVEEDIFRQSWERIMQQHSIFRSGFYPRAFTIPVQCVYRELSLPFTVLDYRNMAPAAQQAALQEYLDADLARGFDFATAPLMRICLIRLDDDRYRLQWTYHHLLLDGWSLPLVIEELLQTYESLATGQSLPIPTEDRFGDFIHYLDHRDQVGEEQYWRSYLQGIDEPSLLPFVRGGMERTRSTGSHKEERLSLDAGLGAQVTRYVQQHHITLNTLMQGVWALLLHRYTGRSSVVYGVTVAGRPEDLPDTERRVGLYINTIPLRAEMKEDREIIPWLQALQKSQLQSREHQHAPLNAVQRWSGVTGDLFDSLLVFENYPVNKALTEQPWQLRMANMQVKEHTNYPLCISIVMDGSLHIDLGYNTQALDTEEVRRIAGHFRQVLTSIIGQPAARLQDIDLLTTSERHQLLHAFNTTASAHPSAATINAMFEEQAAATPDAIALVCEGIELTYRSLDQRVNQLAHYLRDKGVDGEALVPICMERSPEMIVSILAVLKAGGAYVPIDPAYPQQRIGFMLLDTGASIIITNVDLDIPAAGSVPTTIIDIRKEAELIRQSPITPLLTGIHEDNLAYIIYTSGSTGNPKGVGITHRNLVASTQARRDHYGNTGAMLLVPSFSFDSSVAVIFGTLCSGGSLILCPEEGVKEADVVGPLLQQTDTILCVPAYYRFLLDEGLAWSSTLSRVILAGEALDLSLVRRHFAETNEVLLYNEYGPTECTVWSSVAEIMPQDNPITIGKPVGQVKAYILDAMGRVLPIGVAGELQLGGPQVARGYIGLPALTKEKFLPDPFASDAGAHLYKTGDIARWLPDGRIEYLGRVDDQVKIRGYRVELGEIEHALQQCPGVRQAVVIAWSDERNTRRLVGYIVPSTESFDKLTVLSILKTALPEYMVPSVLIELESLPLSVNGKVDKKALPAPDTGSMANAYVAPRNEAEQLLADIWRELLGVERVGIQDNFLELGGDSIISMQVVSRARRVGLRLKPRDLFTCQTIDGLSRFLSMQEEGALHNTGAANGGHSTQNSGLLPIQQWYLDAGGSNPVPFIQHLTLEITKHIRTTDLAQALRQLSRYHDALRFTYHHTTSGWEQTYGNYEPVLEIIDCRSLSSIDLDKEIGQCLEACAARLDITRGILIHAVLLQTPGTVADDRLCITIHHLAVDGVSWRILMEDLEILLQEAGQPTQPIEKLLGRKTASYRQWHDALADYARSPRLTGQLDYWTRQIAGHISLKTDKIYEGAVRVKDRARQIVSLDAANTRHLLQDAPKAYHTEINDILLCALASTIASWNGNSAVLIGVEGHGREHIAPNLDITRTVGWFTTQYPVLLEIGDSADPGSRLKEIKEQLRQVPDKGLGYGVLRYMAQTATLQDGTPWEIGFNYMGQGDNMVQSGSALKLSLSSLGAGGGTDRIVPEKLSVDAIVREGQLVLQWEFSRHHFEQATIAQLADSYLEQLGYLIDHCCTLTGQGLQYTTPADYALSGVMTNRELDQFLDEYQGNMPRREQITAIYRLSPLQEGMLFHGLYEEGGEAYIEQFGCDLTNVDEQYFRQTWGRILQQHSIFRSGFYPRTFSIPVQCVYRELNPPITMLDYRDLTPEAQQAALQQYLDDDLASGFDFAAAPLMRICLVRLSEDRYRMQWTYHHLLLDGWSLPVVIEELLHTYESLITGQALPALKEDRFGDYIRYLDHRDKQGEEQYWRNYLQGVEGPCLLPFIKAGEERIKGAEEYREQSLYLDATLGLQMTRYIQQHHITLNTLMQGIWALLLHRYTGRRNVVYGATVAGRPEDLPGVERKVGLYINTLPLHAAIQEDREIAAWLQEIQLAQLQSREHQHAPLNDVQRWTGIQGELFDTLLVFENYPVSKALTGQAWRLGLDNIQVHEHTNYPLCIIIQTEGTEGATRIDLGYNARLLDAGQVTRIAGHFRQVLTNIVDRSSARIFDVDLLTTPERHQLLQTFNDTRVPYPADKTIVALFEEQAACRPDAIALVFEGIELSYRSLDQSANQLAHYLHSKGVGIETLVPICMERSLDLMIGILAILKAGGAYVPLDPDYPATRLHHMLSDSNSPVILTVIAHAGALSGIREDMELLCMEHIRPLLSMEPTSPLVLPLNSDHLAYVMYTSGSTGRPKGVAVTHRNVVSLTRNTNFVTITPEDALMCMGSISFDTTSFENWGTLLNGARLILRAKDSLLDIRELKEDLRAQRVTRMVLTTGWTNQLIDADISIFEGLTTVVTGGEKISERHVKEFKNRYPHIELVNGYGPTENTVFSLTYLVGSSILTGDTPIGRPLNNRTAYVLDAMQKLQPIGVAGELYVGGEGVARGYVHLPDLTAERFVPDPFAGEPDKKLYKTGDIARWLPDGNIEFLGRIDDQVKIRGYRIEPGEIERVLQQYEGIQQAVVLPWANADGQKYLAGYIVSQTPFDKTAILAFLKSQLPEYMVPAYLVPMEVFPLTANGKVDKKAFKAPDLSALTKANTAPANATEQALALIWQELLGIPRIGTEDNFFELGGHSLLAMRLQSALRKRLDVEVPIKTIFKLKTIAHLSAYIQENDPRSGSVPTIANPAITVAPVTDNMPLSFAQQRFWFMDRLGGSLQYHIPIAFRLKGHLRIDALQYALNEIVNRHEVLRTVILQDEGIARQQLLDKDQWQLHSTAGESLRSADPAADLLSVIGPLVDQPFDLSSDHMLRAQLISLGTMEHILLITIHHIAADGWSLGILMKEMEELYEAHIVNRSHRLLLPEIQYKDYAVWQRRYMSDDRMERQLIYWKEKLDGVTTLQLPTDFPRPAVFSTRGGIIRFQLDSGLLQQLKALSGQEGTTLFMTLLAAFKVLLYRYTGQEDICVGSPVSGRTRQEMEGLIGCFVNTLALRSDCSGDPSFTSLLQQLRETTLNAYEYQELPFEKIVETVVKERDLSRSPLFQVMFVLHNTAPIPAVSLGDVALSNEIADYASAQVDLNCTFEEQEGGLAGSMEYCTDLFQADTIRRMISHYEQLLRSIVLAPDTTISALPMLNRAEQDQLLLDFNDTASTYPTDKTIVSLFEEQVARTPDGIALLAENTSFTYRELDEKTGRLALYLRDQGIRAEMLVPVCMDRSAETIIAILAILKAGGAYVPIDPNYPAQRISYMLSACDSPLALTTEVCLDRLPEMQEGMDWCCVDQIDLMSVAYRREAIAEFFTSIHPDQLAYVIYTSGSTGKPKGVMVTHGNVVSLVYGVDYIAFDPGDRVLSLSAPAFDATTFEYWGMLLHGGCLIICPEQQLLDNAILKAKLRSHRVNTMWITTGWFNQLVDADITIFEGLSTIITGGEKLSEDHAGRLMRHHPAITFINAYGPTENTTFSLTYAVRPDFYATRANGGPTPIGRPLSNRQIYVLDARLRPQPIGVAGEIYLSGAGLSRGYLHLPELTAERFIDHSFEGGQPIRMYRTGDIGRWLPDGNIEFIGRVDEQVKIRGYRIELGEIEAILQQLDGISQAAVVVKEDKQRNKRLVGYLVPAEGYRQETVWAHLKGNLPRYMVPSLLVELDRLPLTSNGKLDKKALPDPDMAVPAGDYTAPRNETEAVLTGIWQELLRLERIGIHDDFFALGGHSLLVTRVISAIRKTLHTEVSVRELFLHTTIAALAGHIQGMQKVSTLPDIVPMLRGDRLPLSSSQRRLWFIDRMEGSINYHIPFTLQLRGAIDKAALAFALRTIVERHEVLRTVFFAEDGEPWQQVLPIDGWQLEEAIVPEDDILPFASQWINTPFDLEKDHLLRAMLIKVSADEHLLIMVLHHIAADGWSVSVLAKELVELYQAYHLQRLHRLEPLPVQYGDYALWQRQYLEGGVLDAQLSYWKQKLQDTTVLQLPTDHPRPTIQSTRGRSLFYTVDPSLTAGLEQLSRQEGATLFMTLLAAFNVLLYRYSGQEDICVGSPIANRTRQAIESLIGFFVNTIALRNDLGGDPDFITLLARVKATLLEAYMHQDAPFDKVVDSVVNDRDMSRTPLFQVMFILQNIPDIPALDLGGVEITPHMVPNTTAKFDLTVDVTRDGEGLAMRVEYCSDLYEEETIARMIRHYLTLLHGVVADPYHKIRTLPILQEEETQQLLSRFNDTDRDVEPGQSVVGLFEQQAARTPDAIAIVCGTQQCTYRQLNEWGNRLAHYLIDQGIGEDSLVPVCMSRSLGMVTAIIGILKAGAAYVPVDPAYPAARIEYILSDISYRVILTDEQSSPSLTQTDMSKALILSEPSTLPEALLAYPITTASRSQRPDRLTYLIYTSGSTGKPKGVEMPDQALVNLLVWQQQAVNNPGPRRVLQFASLNFDVSFQELFYALCFGGSIHLIDEQRRKDMTVLLEQVNAEKITDIFMPYIVLKNLAEHVQESGIYPLHLQEIFTAGEQLRLSRDIETLLDRTHARLHNHYGPSESHVVSAYTVQTADFVHRILPPIGRPISNTRLYILDGAGNLCPIGVPGELYIGGIQVARGYLHLPEMTAERFIADPFDTRPGRRLYKTGDICCWLSDGNIACLGRKDDQVKIRGHRVEIGEVEAVLSRSSLVSQCVVLAKEDPYGGKRLVAYVVPNGAFDKEGIRNDLQTGLPDHMIPSLFISLPELPLTNNAKVNKRALPEPTATAQDLVRYTPPRNRTEQELVSIWETLLQVPQIGIHDNFFELGGHSLLAMRLQSALRKRLGMEIPIRSIFAHPTIARLGSLIRETDRDLALPAIAAGERPRFIPLSYSQERLWFIDQMEGSVQYHMPLVLRLRGRLDRTALERSIQTIIDRHEVLRTVIVLEDGYSCQRVRDNDQWHLNVIDSPVYYGDAMAWRPLAQTLIRKPFDLGRDHMLRADLILLGEEEYVLVMTMHHIASDGWSISILFREFIALYDAFARGHQVELPELDVQYADYAIWQRRHMSDETLALQLQYWKERLKDLSPLMLPADHNRPPVKSNRGAILTHQLDKELTGRLRELSRQQGATLFMTLLAAFKVLLYRYSGQEDICVGSPISGRVRQEVEGLVGFFVNTMALRSDLSGNPTFLALLQQVRQTTLSAYEYQEAPFEKVVDAVVTERDLSRSPLFQVMFILQNTPDVPTLRLGDMELTVEEQDHVTSVFDLNFSLKETSAGLSATIEYCIDLFHADTVARMVRHYEQLLHAIIASPAAHICALPMLDAAGMHQVLHTFNDTAVDYPADLTLIDLFDAQVRTRGEETALVFGKARLSYRQLYERSCQLAYQLRNMGVTKDSLVPLCTERSLEMIVAILGIMRAGGAYVPVDPVYPLERISYILEDTRASLMICSPAVQQQLGSVTASLAVLLLQSADPAPADHPAPSWPLPKPDHLAYVIYTSGSTGKPKGVLIAHGGVVNLVETQRDLLQLRPGDRLLQFASFGFDASCLEIFHTLTAGAVLVLPRKEDLLSHGDFSALINDQQLDIVCLPPPYLHNIKETLGRVKTVVCGGEPMNREDARYLQSRGIRFVNAYGPTETTICATCTADPITKDNVVVIGRPIANFQLYILDTHGGLCPPGIPGEICVSGPGLAKGYLFRPELTAQKFVPNPFAQDKDTLMYRTGDLGRWLSDGNIEYLGRIDDQVKVRGYRIEPGEIEYVLHACELVNQAVVLVKGADSDTRRLVGYIVPRGDFDREGILAYLKRKLPDYMIPSFLIAVTDLPRTANGKIDKKALPELDSVSLYRSQAAAGPRNDIEAQLLQIWKEVLGLPQLSIHDNFFASGGNSIIAIRLMAKMKQNFQVSINDLFQHPTVEDISRYVIYEKDHFRNRLKTLMTAYAAVRPDPEERVAREALAREEMLRQKQDYIQRIRQFQDTDLSRTIPYQKILLLGATGYLGIHLLYELLHRQEADICVIVRADTDEAALRRLAEKYTFYFSEPLEKVSTRLRVYKGDISLPGFGMTTEAFQTLSREIDCIINAAANVNHYGQYHEFEAANIRPLLSLLDICANGNVKALHHISTTSIAGKKPKGSPDHLFTEADVYKGQMAGNFYTKSKLEAELLLDKARAGGMNINIYRVGHLGFHSRTGRFQENMDNNALYTQIKGFVALGALPAHMGSLELSNIDQVAGAILQLFDKEQLLNRNYHISNPHVLTAEEFAACLNSYGFETELVNTLAYIEKMLEAYETKKDLINRLFLQAELFSEEAEDEGVFQLCYEQTNMLLGRLGFEWGEINEQKVHLMLGYAAGTGFFDPGHPAPDGPGSAVRNGSGNPAPAGPGGSSADAGPRSNLSTTFH